MGKSGKRGTTNHLLLGASDLALSPRTRRPDLRSVGLDSFAHLGRQATVHLRAPFPLEDSRTWLPVKRLAAALG